jgi:hypothetical protein
MGETFKILSDLFQECMQIVMGMKSRRTMLAASPRGHTITSPMKGITFISLPLNVIIAQG